MQYSVQDLCNHLGNLVLAKPEEGGYFSIISSIENVNNDSLVFISEARDSQLVSAAEQKPALVVTRPEIAKEFVASEYPVVLVSNVRLALALSKQKFHNYDASDSEWASIHPSAVIHPSAKLGNNVRIGPNSVIGANVVLGEGVQVRANCVIEHGANIGADSVLHNLVNVGYNCVVGERVIIRPGAIIGNEGFGFAQDDHHRYHRVPHTGIVEVGDDVQIGSNCNIDRGTFGVTTIARGVKIDALCHVAHNVHVDEDALFVAQCGVAGSSNVGKRVVLSGQTGVLDHKNIADDAQLVHRCGVTHDIPEGGVWAGIPPKPFKEYVREVGLAKRVAKLEKLLKDYESHQAK